MDDFGDYPTPKLDLATHCYPTIKNNCTWLSKEIKACQDQGIKVFLSMGDISGPYTLVSPEDARQLATYLWNNFLGGQSDSRPLGDAVLDGIDFFH